MTMPREMPRLREVIRRLEEAHGAPAPPAATDPFEMVVWENCAYLVDDARRAEVFRRLKAKVGLAPEDLLACPLPELARVVERGGMQPLHRAEKLQRAARIALELGLAELRRLLREEPTKARRALQRFPGFGEPGADKALLFNGAARTLAPDSNALRTLVRLGFGREEKDYRRTYRTAAEAVGGELPDDFPWLVRSHQLLRRHGREVCKASVPRCEICPLTGLCRWHREHSRPKS
jgi:endonuclease III